MEIRDFDAVDLLFFLAMTFITLIVSVGIILFESTLPLHYFFASGAVAAFTTMFSIKEDTMIIAMAAGFFVGFFGAFLISAAIQQSNFAYGVVEVFGIPFVYAFSYLAVTKIGQQGIALVQHVVSKWRSR